jgi:transcriptional regulator with XRE-family HTH domain
MNTIPEITRNIGSAVRDARRLQNISIRELARRSGLSATGIWKIEQGKMSPSIVVVIQIAHGLGIKLTELLDPLLEEETVVHTTHEARTSGSTGDLRDIAEIISGTSRAWIAQAAEHILKKRAWSGRQPMQHSGEELAYCLEGHVQYVIDGKAYDLKAGDSLHFKAHLPHLWRNVNNGISRMLIIAIPPRMSSH